MQNARIRFNAHELTRLEQESIQRQSMLQAERQANIDHFKEISRVGFGRVSPLVTSDSLPLKVNGIAMQ